MPNTVSISSLSGKHLHVGLVGTYPPKLCGLATFGSALVQAFRRAGDRVDVVRIDDGEDNAPSPGTVGDLVIGSARSIRQAAVRLSRGDVAIIQHEYGIYGGRDGDEVLALLEALTAPAIVTLHTVPLHPTPNQRLVLEAIAALADRVVVMSAAANTRLIELYDIDPAVVVTIPHGATSPSAAELSVPGTVAPQLLTWGLLGPGKGIEHVIDALGLLAETGLRPHYTVAGVTHPKVLAHFGDDYRESLIRRSHAAGLDDSVTFDDTYRNVSQLMRFVASAAVVVLPYDSRDQVTSGVLVDAIAAGRPVIATAFPHAIELLGDGAGIVVPHGEPAAMAEAIRSVLTRRGVADAMATRAREIAPSLAWSSVAARYRSVAGELLMRNAVAI